MSTPEAANEANPLLLDQQLTEDERMVRESARQFAESKLRPRVLEAFRNAVPMKRLAQPEDYPGVIALLASDDANFITGQVISVSGGLTMAG